MHPAIRLDLMHSGGSSDGKYELVGMHAASYADPFLSHELDVRGDYRWVVRSTDGMLIGTRGFSVLFDEWQSTIEEGRPDSYAEFRETYIVPWHPYALMVIEKRIEGNRFSPVFECRLPNYADLPPISAGLRDQGRQLRRLAGRGSVNFLFVAEGFTQTESDRFFERAALSAELIGSTRPYRDFEDTISFSALFIPSSSPGIPCAPHSGDSTTFETSYGVFGMERYLVSLNLHKLREVTSGIRNSTLIVLTNSEEYGGSGVFNSNCVVAAGMNDADFQYVLLHELGHSLGGLADEYFATDVAYLTGRPGDMDRWEPNVSPLDTHGKVKWSSRIEANIPVPTPWSIDRYIESCVASPSNTPAENIERRLKTSKLLASEPYAGKIGAFEGAWYQARGMYRCEVDCRMFTRTATQYCAICAETLANAIRTAKRAADGRDN